MNYRIKKATQLAASVVLPASKSISNRALIINALSDNPKEIRNLSVCDDTEVLRKALSEESNVIDIHAAGTAMRFLTAYFSCREGEWMLTGTERMKKRPIKILVEALHEVGADIEYTEKEGFPPLLINGKTLSGGEICLDGRVSSQYISALLMVAPMMTNGLRLHLEDEIVSQPYIRMTMDIMREYGVVVYDDWPTLTIPMQQYFRNTEYVVESDWSAASYWYEMMALSQEEGAEVTLNGLMTDSLQGDSAIDMLFHGLGVRTTYDSDGIVLTKRQRKTKTLEYDFISMPDMAQTFVVTCAMLGIPFRFSGLQSLKIKETDRMKALQTEMRKLGYPLNVIDNRIIEWGGERCEAESMPTIETYDDHRMAMAFAPAAIQLTEGITISNPDVVTKSYPRYWDDLHNAGFTIEQLF